MTSAAHVSDDVSIASHASYLQGLLGTEVIAARSPHQQTSAAQ